MIVARAGRGRETVLADLCLILFMVTASALSHAHDGPEGAAAGKLEASPQSQPLALYRAEEGAPPLREWLEFQAPDPRQQLTIVAQYRPGEQARALALAGELSAHAGAAGAGARVFGLPGAGGPGGTPGPGARIVVEPGAGGTVATLAYDAPDPVLARGLQGRGRTHPVPETSP